MARATRVRDYRAEEAKRNAKARELGFTTRAAQRSAEKRGERPAARALKNNAELAAKTKRDDTVRRGKLAGFDGVTSYRDARQKAERWSKDHSRQPLTARIPTDPVAFRQFYQGIVEPWGKPRNSFHRANLKSFMTEAGGLTEDEWEAGYDVSTQHWR